MEETLSLHRVSKFESKASIEAIGNWVAVHNPRVRIAAACAKVDGEHAFPLICIIDVVLKFSEKSQMEIGPCVASWLHALPRIPDKRMVVSAAAMVLNWVHYGAVNPSCIHTNIANLSGVDAPGDRVHACPICRLRFASLTVLGSHVEAHRESAARVSAQQKCATLGLFLAIDETRRTKRAQNVDMPELGSSPIPVDGGRDYVTNGRLPSCRVCGDPIVKSFSDVHNSFVWENCRRIVTFAAEEMAECALVHDECAADYFDCKLSSRPFKKIKSAEKEEE